MWYHCLPAANMGVCDFFQGLEGYAIEKCVSHFLSCVLGAGHLVVDDVALRVDLF